MTAGEIIAGIVALIIAYLIGSIPSAYIVARRERGEDIRRLGVGNVGGMNVYREVGAKAGIAVAIADIAKGAGAVAVAHWLLKAPQAFVLLAGAAAVAGHMWMIFLRFGGGGGLGASVGVLSALMLLYDYQLGLVIFLAVIITGVIVTHNVYVSAQIGFSLLPVITWLSTKSLVFTLFTVGLGLLMGIKLFPRIKREWDEAGSLKNYVFRSSFRRH